MRNWLRVIPIIVCLAAVLAVGCGSSDSDDTSTSAATQTAAETTPVPEPGETPNMTGPNGERAVGPDAVELSAADVARIRAGDYTVAFVWHALGLDIDAAELAARKRLDELGIRVVATTNANYDPGKQQNDLQTVEALKPDVIVSLPVDTASSAPMYRAAAKNGSRLIFFSNIPAGFVHGKDYVGVVTTDVVGAARETAMLLGKKLGGRGKIGVLFYDADFFIVNQWDRAFEDTIKQQFPDIEIAARQGFADPTKADEPASAMVTRNPDLDAIYVSWNDPAQGVLTALRSAGKTDVAVTDVGIDEVTAVDMLSSNGVFIGAGVDGPSDAGRALANEIGLAALGKEGPAFMASGYSLMTSDNVVDNWQRVYGTPAPDPVIEAAGD